MTNNTKNWKRKNTKDIYYHNSLRRFRPYGSRVMALSIKSEQSHLKSLVEVHLSLSHLFGCQ